MTQVFENVKLAYELFWIEMAEMDDSENCIIQREKALKTSNETGIPVFVPVCHEDGSFVDVQCFYGTGYCWCVNEEGQPVPGEF